MIYFIFDENGEMFDVLNFINDENLELFKKNNPTYSLYNENELDDFFEEDDEIDE